MDNAANKNINANVVDFLFVFSLKRFINAIIVKARNKGHMMEMTSGILEYKCSTSLSIKGLEYQALKDLALS